MVGTMVERRRRRASARVFQGEHGFITPRDLFRAGRRQPADHDELAAAGYARLPNGCARATRRAAVLQVLRQLIPHGTLDPAAAYAAAVVPTAGPSTPVWIASMRRLYSLVSNCCQYDEPVLLVGETARVSGRRPCASCTRRPWVQTLHMINCHQHAETADFIDGTSASCAASAMQLARLLRRVEAFERRAAAAAAALADGSAVPPAADADADGAAGNGDAAAASRRSVAALEGSRRFARLGASRGGGGGRRRRGGVRGDGRRRDDAATRRLTLSPANVEWVDGPSSWRCARDE